MGVILIIWMDCNRLLLWREPVFNFENKKFIFHTQKRKTINQPVLRVAFTFSPISIPFPVYISAILLLQQKSHLEIFRRSWKNIQMLVTESLGCRLFSVINISNSSPPYFVSNICYQHKCNQNIFQQSNWMSMSRLIK